ncbi:MAG: acyl-CoA dehydrogenase family protein, partial [Candidatus Limnocylindrales bacterium]
MFPWPLTTEQQELLEWAGGFARAEIEPFVEKAERERMLPPSISQRFHESGVATQFLSGTTGDDFVATASMLAEELSYACASFASHLMLPVFFNRVVLSYLPPAERDQFLKRCLEEPVVTSFAASEAAAGSDLLALSTTATRHGDSYVLRGRKEYSSNIRAAQYVIVVARTGPEGTRATDTMSWFLVPTDAPGVVIGERWLTFGLRALDISPLELNDVEVPAAYMLGAEGR